ncbi:MAG: DUF1292 domain-containing protein [Eubacterium sp.]|nr:DUF1292 domain-containing protein [Eubacterium sp.]
MAENKEIVEIITLEFDDDTRMDCEIMGIFDYDGKDYIALIPEDGSDDVYIYGYEEDEEENFELIDITDDELFSKVAHEFEAIMASQDE